MVMSGLISFSSHGNKTIFWGKKKPNKFSVKKLFLGNKNFEEKDKNLSLFY